MKRVKQIPVAGRKRAIKLPGVDILRKAEVSLMSGDAMKILGEGVYRYVYGGWSRKIKAEYTVLEHIGTAIAVLCSAGPVMLPESTVRTSVQVLEALRYLSDGNEFYRWLYELLGRRSPVSEEDLKNLETELGYVRCRISVRQPDGSWDDISFLKRGDMEPESPDWRRELLKKDWIMEGVRNDPVVCAVWRSSGSVYEFYERLAEVSTKASGERLKQLIDIHVLTTASRVYPVQDFLTEKHTPERCSGCILYEAALNQKREGSK